MNALPITAFPIGAKATGSSTFVVAVLMGLALYMASRNASTSKTKN